MKHNLFGNFCEMPLVRLNDDSTELFEYLMLFVTGYLFAFFVLKIENDHARSSAAFSAFIVIYAARKIRHFWHSLHNNVFGVFGVFGVFRILGQFVSGWFGWFTQKRLK